LILGGPGCGKTHFLLDLILTRKASREGRERAALRFGLTDEELPHFRTIHSFSLRELGISADRLMTNADYRDFAEGNGLDLEYRQIFGEDRIAGSMHDKCFNAGELSRAMMQSLGQVCEERRLPYGEASYIHRAFNEYKRDTRKLDFTDMLEQFIEKGAVPPLKVLIVDEAQDLTRLQWKVVEKIAVGVEDIVIAGDDDQAIFEWAGADLPYFLNLKGKEYVLPRSYRLKRNIFDLSKSIVQNVLWRFDKDFSPRAEGGVVNTAARIENANYDEGTWYLLARHHTFLRSFEPQLFNEGRGFITAKGVSSFDTPEVAAMLSWNSLQSGEAITRESAKHLYSKLTQGFLEPGRTKKLDVPDDAILDAESLSVEHGLNHLEQPWENAIMMHPQQRSYLQAALKRGEDLTAMPRITISTIHGVKGGEADHVVLRPDMSRNAEKSLRANPSSESRVFYVGASRAKESLTIISPYSPRYYRIGERV
jgi:superfamily I DNA/RNA helicase